MAGYALGLIIVLRILRSRRKILLLAILASPRLRRCSAILQAPCSGRVRRSRPRRKEPLLLVPLAVALVRDSSVSSGRSSFCSCCGDYNHFGLGANGTTLCDSAILYGCFAAALTLIFGHEHFHAHIVARLQPLRAFLMIYAHHVSAARRLDAAVLRARLLTVLMRGTTHATR